MGERDFWLKVASCRLIRIPILKAPLLFKEGKISALLKEGWFLPRMFF
jgi:hypothetical protein